MKRPPGRYRELTALLEALCEDRLTPEQARRLELLVLNDREARQFYLDYIALHGALYWDAAISPGDSFPELSTELRATPGDMRVTPGEVACLETSPRSDRATARHAARSTDPAVSTVTEPDRKAHRSQTPQRAPVKLPAAASPKAAARGRRSLGAAGLLVACGLCFAIGIWLRGEWRGVNPPMGTDVAANHAAHPDPPAVGGVPSAEAPDGPPLRGPVTLSRNYGARTEDGPAAPLEIHRDVASESAAGPRGPAAFEGFHSGEELVRFINRQLQTRWEEEEVTPSPRADDAEWIRRVYLDLAGHIPPVEAVEAFLADESPRKRAELVDRLLDEPSYVRHWTTIWTNLLIGRSESRDVSRPAMQKYLRESFAENRPWDEMVVDFIGAEGNFEEQGETNFLLAHLNNEAVPATAITARVFLGIQVHCTQCHDHPFNDWKQEQFWTLNSFFQQTKRIRRRVSTDSAEPKITTELASISVGGPTYYETLRGVMRVAYPRFEGDRISIAPDVNRRAELAKLMVQGEKPQVAEALVNRLWGHFFGYSFTRRVDDMGPHSPPSHPDVLDRLARAFVYHGYDMKQLIRWICNTEAYHLTSRFNETNGRDDPAIGELPLFSRMYVKSMTAEQVYDSLIMATSAHNARASSWEAAEEQRQQWLQQFVIAFETDENDEAVVFEGTVPQALMMMNGDLMAGALGAQRGTFFEEVLSSEGSEIDKVRKLCLSALSREPTPQELAAVRKLLRQRLSTAKTRAAREAAVVETLQDIFWAYLNSNEFVLVH